MDAEAISGFGADSKILAGRLSWPAVDLALMLIALAGVSFVVFVAALVIGDAIRTKRDEQRERQYFDDAR